MKALISLDKWLNHPFPRLRSGNKDNHGCPDLLGALRDTMPGKQAECWPTARVLSVYN